MIKELIQTIHKHIDSYNADFKDLFTLLASPERNDRQIFEQFNTLFNKYPAHPVLIVLFTDCLQICTDEELLGQYELQDVKDLLEKSCDTYKDDLELNIEHYHFIKNVEDDEEEAALYFNSFRERINILLHEDDEEL